MSDLAEKLWKVSWFISVGLFNLIFLTSPLQYNDPLNALKIKGGQMQINC